MAIIDQQESPFLLDGALKVLPGKTINRPIELILERILSLKQLDALYRGISPSQDEQAFLQEVFDAFNISYQVSPDELARIPRMGRMVVVANHPFGAIEGVILAALLKQVRPDIKIMANFILKRIPELQDMFIAVDPFGGKNAVRNNTAPMKEALRWLKQDGLLVVFPAGEVSHLKPGNSQVVDPQWSASIGRLIQLAEAPVEPVYFHGANSLLFQLAGMMHPRLRTAMLPRELIRRANTSIPVRIGKPIPYNKLKRYGDATALIDYLKLRTYMLKNAEKHSNGGALSGLAGAEHAATVIEAVDSEAMQAEIASLPAQQLLFDAGEMRVYCANARQIPNLLNEIGRLREISFRAVGEGTGKEIDLDFYDRYYLHLFVWNSERSELVGSYRLGLADKIISKQGLVGLYSYSLFKYSRRLIDEINPAIELGRSFVHPDYQKSFAPLMLLWKGIARFVSNHPQYRKLFGPVSISGDYQPASQQLLVDFLKINNALPGLARQVKARRPFRKKTGAAVSGVCINNIDQLSDLIAEIERDQKGIPILLKQYLKLGGQILGFNVDDQFNNSLDGLIMVDLLQTDKKTLAKYMGKAGVATYHAFHQDSVMDKTA